MTQHQKLARHFLRKLGTSTYSATVCFGICRLSERIREIEGVGVRFERDPHPNKGGGAYVEYFAKPTKKNLALLRKIADGKIKPKTVR